MIILTRHGEAGDTKGTLHGWTEDGLTIEGKKEIKELGKELPKVSIIYSSPLKRNLQSSQILADKLKAKIESADELICWNLGYLVGKPVEDYLDELKYYAFHPKVKIPKGESFETFASRFLPFLDECLRKSGKILFQTHGRNVLLAKAHLLNNLKGYDLNFLKNNELALEHGGYAVMTKHSFDMVHTKKVPKGMS